jgi:hypothetical protein
MLSQPIFLSAKADGTGILQLDFLTEFSKNYEYISILNMQMVAKI